MNRRISATLVFIMFAALAAACGSVSHPTSSPTSVTAPTSPTTATTDVVVMRPPRAVFPPPGAAPLASPRGAARAFATTYLSFPEPTVGTPEASSSTTAVVPVRSNPAAPVTSVAVQRVGIGWWVMGAESPDLIVEGPRGLGVASSPLLVTGRSTAYEAVINVAVRAADGTTSLGKTTAMGGSMGVMGPFETTVSFGAPPTSTGALVVTTISPKDGSVLEATVVALRFG